MKKAVKNGVFTKVLYAHLKLRVKPLLWTGMVRPYNFLKNLSGTRVPKNVITPTMVANQRMLTAPIQQQ